MRDATSVAVGIRRCQLMGAKNMWRVLVKMYAITIILTLLICGLLIRYPTAGFGFIALFILLWWAAPSAAMRPQLPPTLSPLSAEQPQVYQDLLYNNPPACALNDGLVDAVPQMPVPVSAVSSVVLESDPLPNPGQVDRMCESQWFPRNQRRNLKEQQRDDFSLQRSMRRDHEWGDTRTWSAEDKARYERARSRMEKEIAGALKPDRYMIAELDPERDYNFTSDQPFSSVTSDSQVFHTAHFRIKSGNTGDFASLLRTTI